MVRTLDFLLPHQRDETSVRQIKEAMLTKADATVLLKRVALQFKWDTLRVYVKPREVLHDAKMIPIELPYDVLMELLEDDHG